MAEGVRARALRKGIEERLDDEDALIEFLVAYDYAPQTVKRPVHKNNDNWWHEVEDHEPDVDGTLAQVTSFADAGIIPRKAYREAIRRRRSGDTS